MKKRTVLALSALTAALFVSNQSANAYEIYFTYPGTRAMSMAGAFHAQADDSSAIWYNPAGLVQPGKQTDTKPSFDFTAEYGSVPSWTNNTYNSSDKEVKFVSVGWNPSSNRNIGFGFSYFVPYQIALYIPNPTYAPIGRLDASYRQISGAVSYKLFEKLSVGGTLDYVFTNIDTGATYNNSFSGFGGSIGALLKVYESDKLGVKAGAVWRSQVDLKDASASYGSNAYYVEQNLPSRPESWGGGISVNVPVPQLSLAGATLPPVNLNLNTGYDKILWSKAFPSTFNANGLDFTRISYGGEALIPVSGAVKSAIHLTQVALRGGWNEANPDNKTLWIASKSTTYGLGMVFDEKLNLDFAFENRTRVMTSSSPDTNFWSVSIAYQY